MRTSLRPRIGRLGTAVAAAVGVVLLTAVPATAHVSVSSPDAEAGGFGKLVFRVPNESDSASTTRLQVQLPTDTPFASVSAKAMPGWMVEAEPTKLPRPTEVAGATLTEAVTTVTWTADAGSALPPGQFAEFELSVGPFPENAESLTLPAIQTYSDGEVVAWDQVAQEGAAEPEHPAPVLELAGAADTAPTEPASATSAVSTTPDDTDALARTLGGAAVVLAAGALLWAVLSARRAGG